MPLLPLIKERVKAKALPQPGLISEIVKNGVGGGESNELRVLHRSVRRLVVE